MGYRNCDQVPICVSLVTGIALVLHYTRALVGQSNWAWSKKTTFGELTGQELKVSCRSRLECAALCVDCPAYVYNSTSRTCHVSPRFSYVTDTSLHTSFFHQKGAKCSIDSAPSPPDNGTVTTWEYTATTLRGKVTCSPDFINVTNEVIWQCDVTEGVWTAQGCAQRVWRNPPLSVSLPAPMQPMAGWSMCLDGVLIGEDRITIYLMSGAAIAKTSLVVDFRLKVGQLYTVITNYFWSGSWGPEYVKAYGNAASYPLVLGQPFRIRILVTGSGQYEVYKNNTLLMNNIPQHSSLPPSSVTHVLLGGDIGQATVDLFCTN